VRLIYAPAVTWRPLLLVVAATLAGCASLGPDVVTIREMRVLESTAETPPPAIEPGWRDVRLPDYWRIPQRQRGPQSWYRATLTLDRTPATLWAVYVPRVCMNAAVYVNGVLVGDGGRFTEPVARNWARPLLFTVPARLLVAGTNIVDLRVKVPQTAPGFLLPIMLGPEQSLQPAYVWRFVSQVTVAQAVAVATLVLAALIGTIYSAHYPADAHRWFVSGILLWGWTAADTFVRDIPVSSRLWEWTTQSATNWFAPCLVMGFHRVLGLARPRLERLLLVHMIGGALVLAVISPYYTFAWYILWAGVTLATGVYLITLIAAAARANPGGGAQRLLLPGIVAVVLGTHDVAGILFGGTGGVLLTPYMAPAALLGSAWGILVDLANGLTESERLNRELERRVEEKHAELEENYARLHELERGRAVAGERDRIMRDMHDGMGGQLVSTLAMVESGRFTPEGVTAALRGALDDLRLVIDSLDPTEGDLLAVLGTIRARLEPRLSQHGMRFDWQVADVPALPDLTPERVLQVLRILQEAITNVLKHAAARTIVVSTGHEAGADGRPLVFVEIRDDGRGMDGGTKLGRGLANMARRAQALGATLSVESGPNGTAVRLRLPIAAAA